MPTYQTNTSGRRTRRRTSAYKNVTWKKLLWGLLAAIGTTLAGVLLFALLMQWLRPSDTVIRVVNQLIKLLAILAGTWVFVGKGGEQALMKGAGLGLIYMGLGVGLYALLSGQQLPFSAYLADLAMGIAGGGIAGAVLGNLRK